MTKRELFDLLSAYFLLSFALAVIIERKTWFERPFSSEAFIALVEPLKLSLLTLGIAFVVHEGAHRSLAYKWGGHAEFRAFWVGLALSIVLATFVGVLIAMPGAVMVTGLPPERMGRVALAGPLSNLLLIPFFLSLSALEGYWVMVSIWGVTINAILAFFNLLPVRGLDGGYVYEWDKRVWAGAFLVSGAIWVYVLIKLVGV